MLRKLFVAFLAAILCFALVAQASTGGGDQIYDEAGIMANETSPSPSNAPAANITASPSSAPVAPSVSPSSAPVANTTASPSPSASPKPKLLCGNYTGCGNCTEQWNCVWCDSDSKCEDGGVWGPNQNPFNSCPDWRWRQCKGTPPFNRFNFISTQDDASDFDYTGSRGSNPLTATADNLMTLT